MGVIKSSVDHKFRIRPSIQYSTVQYCTVHYSTVQYIDGRILNLWSTLLLITAVINVLINYGTSWGTVWYIIVRYSILQYSTVYRRPYSKFTVDTTLDNSGHKCINKLRNKLGCKIFNELCSKRHSD